MEQYTINTISINEKSIENELINNSELDIDYCCKLKNKLTVYAKDITIKSLQAKGYNFIKTPVKKLVKNRAVTAKTIIFDNLITNKHDFQNFWETPIAESWYNRFF